VLARKLEAQRKRCARLAGKSTLSRLEHAPEEGRDLRASANRKYFEKLEWVAAQAMEQSLDHLPGAWVHNGKEL